MILSINVFQVKEQHIKNEQVRAKFHDIRTIEDMIHERQLRWLSKIARMPDTKPAKQLLNAWCNHPRPRGRPHQTIRNCQVKALQRIIPGLSEAALTSEWIHLAQDRKVWDELMATAGLRQVCISR